MGDLQSKLNLKDIEFIGILCFTCACGEKFVINTTQIANGAWYKCSCGQQYSIPEETELCLQVIPGDNCTITSDDKAYEAMSLSAYKSKLAEWVVTGKMPQTPAKHKKTVEFDARGVNIGMIVKSLAALGLSTADATAKVKAAIDLDILMEEDIVKYVLEHT